MKDVKLLEIDVRNQGAMLAVKVEIWMSKFFRLNAKTLINM